MVTSHTDANTRAFEAVTAADMDGKENLLVMVTSVGKVQAATAGNAIGVMLGKLNYGGADITVRMLGKNGTFNVIQKAAITCGALVCQDPSNPTKVITYAAATGGQILGRKVGQGSAGADGDVIEVQDMPFLPYVLTTAPTLGAGTSQAITDLTFSSQATQSEANALKAKVALMNTDIIAIHTALVATGIIHA